MHCASTISTTLVFAIAAATSTAFGQSTQSEIEKLAVRGNELANKLCATCHLTPGSNSAGQPAAPTLRALANVPGQTGARLRNLLISPGHQMPDINLSGDEIVALIAYLDTLRTDRKTPLLTPSGDNGKPPPPSKS